MRRHLLLWALPAAIVVVWELAVRAGWLPPAQAVAPSSLLGVIYSQLTQGNLLSHLTISSLRLLAGVGAGALTGSITGLVLAESRVADQAIGPSLRFFGGVPVVVWMPFFIV